MSAGLSMRTQLPRNSDGLEASQIHFAEASSFFLGCGCCLLCMETSGRTLIGLYVLSRGYLEQMLHCVICSETNSH
jgi:hypothetical protein